MVDDTDIAVDVVDVEFVEFVFLPLSPIVNNDEEDAAALPLALVVAVALTLALTSALDLVFDV